MTWVKDFIMKISLQTKVLSLISILLLLIIILLAVIFSYMQALETERHVEQLAQQAARSISLMPEIITIVEKNEKSQKVHSIAARLKEQIDAEDVIIENRKEIVYSYSAPDLIGEKNFDYISFRALVFGGSYTMEAPSHNGPSLLGVVPIYADNGNYNKVLGVVIVKFLKKDIYNSIYKQIKSIALFSLVVLMVGIIGGIFLTKSIRKDTLGLEPHEISSLYRERNAIILSIKEGVIAFNQQGKLTLINHSASKMLNLTEADIGQDIEEIIPDMNMMELLKSGKALTDIEISINGTNFIFSIIPIIENDSIVGGVASFKDKTELKKIMDTLSEVKDYSEGLRAQTHEFANKLYLLSGLLQLGRHKEAYEYIQQESKIHHTQNQILFSQIRDTNIQAILLGKIGKASELKIQFEIDQESSIDTLPPHITVSDLVTMIGNIIDNAFDAVRNEQMKQVTFNITDIGNDIIIEVIDYGKGIPDDKFDSLFIKGYSSKGKNRGYGLFNVKDVVTRLEGTIEVSPNQGKGTIFTIYLPKKYKNHYGVE